MLLGLRLAAWLIYTGRREGSLWLSKEIAFRRSGDSNSRNLSRCDQMTRTVLRWQRIWVPRIMVVGAQMRKGR